MTMEKLHPFADWSDEQKLESLEEKLADLHRFLKEIDVEGRSYSGSTHLHVTELEWLVAQAAKNIRTPRS